MGLDMYFTARRWLFSGGKDDMLIDEIGAKLGIPPVDKDAEYGTAVRVSEIIINVAYWWRKANAIHNWFVKNVQGGIDNCERFYVSREDMKKLISTCKEVLADTSKAETLLPSTSGFFFGSTEYDEWYYRNLEKTVKMLEHALNLPALKDCDFYYQSSW